MATGVAFVIVAIAGIARADDEPAVAPLVGTAHELARQGRCIEVQAIADRVHTLDAGFYARAFINDAELAVCLRAPDPTPRVDPYRIEPYFELSLAGVVASHTPAPDGNAPYADVTGAVLERVAVGASIPVCLCARLRVGAVAYWPTHQLGSRPGIGVESEFVRRVSEQLDVGARLGIETGSSKDPRPLSGRVWMYAIGARLRIHHVVSVGVDIFRLTPPASIYTTNCTDQGIAGCVGTTTGLAVTAGLEGRTAGYAAGVEAALLLAAFALAAANHMTSTSGLR